MQKTNLEDLLKYIDPASLSYEEWLNVGMALKQEGFPIYVWQDWSATDTERYDPDVCEQKWESFKRDEVTGGTIVQMAKDRGWSAERKIKVYMSDDKYKPIISWEDEYIEPEQQFSEPTAWNPVKDLIKYLEVMFEPGDTIGYTMKSVKTEKGKYVPMGDGAYTNIVGQLIDLLKDGEPIERVFGSYDKKAGAWIRINPLDGNGIKDKNVVEYKHILVECDDLGLDEQIEILEKIKIPISALVYSGGKSVHALVPVNASSETEYRFQFNFIKNILHDAGMDIDKSNINPSRLSRLPGVVRGDHKQFLIKTNIGMKSYEEWREWVLAMNDGLPDIVNLRDVWDEMPPLKPELIEGILRQGHKMIIASTSKAGKTFILMELAMAIAEGYKWLGHKCKQGKVLYVNMELDGASFFHRFYDIYNAMGLNHDNHIDNIDVWNLRGNGRPLKELTPLLINRMRDQNYVAVMIDPLYKVMDGDENSNSDVARMVSSFDKIAEETGASVIYAHHFAKGTSANKSIIDRAAGAGTFARDPDAILTMTQLDWAPEIEAEQDWTAWRVESTLREFKAIQPVDLFFDWPLHHVDYDGRLAEKNLLSNENNKKSEADKKQENDVVAGLIRKCKIHLKSNINCFERSEFLKKNAEAGYPVGEESVDRFFKQAGYVTMNKIGHRGFWCKAEDLTSANPIGMEEVNE